jgi:uncharacterized protein YhdP
MNEKLKGICVSAVLLLAACGAPGADQAASTAASAANQAASALPSDVASAAASAVNQAASALPSAASAAASALAEVTPSDLAGIVPSNLALQSSQPLVLDVTSQVAGVSNYRWTIAQVPPGGESVQGTVIGENSDGKLTINPSDYAKYFPVSGNYVVNLLLTNTNGSTNTVPIPVIVP